MRKTAFIKILFFAVFRNILHIKNETPIEKGDGYIVFKKKAEIIAARNTIIQKGMPAAKDQADGNMKKRNKMFILVLACSILTGSTVGVTYSYLTANDNKANMISVTDAEIHIEENFTPPVDPEPGDIITKSPKVVNDSDVPVKVRMSAKFSDSGAEEQCEPLLIDSNWIQKGDYYYYNKELAPGESTIALFNYIKIKESVNKEDLIPFDILVYAEAIQSYGNVSEDAWS